MGEGRRHAVNWVLDVLRDVGPDEGHPVARDVIDWHDVVRFASSHLVLPALAERLGRACVAPPEEVHAFLDEIAVQNGERNAFLRRALLEMGEAFGSLSAAAVVLKGGAFLVEARSADAPAAWRFMSDLDVLVAEEDFLAARRRLEGLGYQASEGAGERDGVGRAHAVPMVAPCGTFSVDVHTRLSDRTDGGLPLSGFRGGALPVATGLSVPRPEDRLAHMIAHAQLHNRNAVLGRLVLKDIVDLTVLAGRVEIDGDVLDRLFPGSRARWAAGAFVAAGQAFGVASGYRARPRERAWARRALSRVKWPRWQAALALPGDMARLEAFRLNHEDGHLGRRVALLGQPGRLAGAAGRWAYKQRQRLWA